MVVSVSTACSVAVVRHGRGSGGSGGWWVVAVMGGGVMVLL